MYFFGAQNFSLRKNLNAGFPALQTIFKPDFWQKKIETLWFRKNAFSSAPMADENAFLRNIGSPWKSHENEDENRRENESTIPLLQLRCR